jgi:hypothetical protein
MNRLYKYPRTPHLAGSQPQPGDEDLSVISLNHLKGERLIVEEKLDGANSALSFSRDGQLLLQSRGHFLDGGPRERHFGLLKAWAGCHQVALREALGSRFIMYGEWLYAKHTIFYDHLPHYFFEFDLFDKERELFLTTDERQRLLQGLPLRSAPVLFSGSVGSGKQLRLLIRNSDFQSSRWREVLREVCASRKLDAERALRETDHSGLMEGLYLKVEEGGRVTERFKFVRSSFLQAVDESGDHWLNRPIIPNQLREGVDIFAPRL